MEIKSAMQATRCPVGKGASELNSEPKTGGCPFHHGSMAIDGYERQSSSSKKSSLIQKMAQTQMLSMASDSGESSHLSGEKLAESSVFGRVGGSCPFMRG